MSDMEDVILRKVCDCIFNRTQMSKRDINQNIKESSQLINVEIDTSYYTSRKYKDFMRRKSLEIWN